MLQTNPAQTTQVKYTAVLSSGWCSNRRSASWTARPTTPISRARRPMPSDTSTSRSARRISRRTAHEHQPNSRHQFDNSVSYNVSGFGGEHFLKAGVQWARLYYESRYTVQGHHYVEYSNGVPKSHSPVQHPRSTRKTSRNVLGFFLQDAWSIGPRLTLNLGAPLRQLQRNHSRGVKSDVRLTCSSGG